MENKRTVILMIAALFIAACSGNSTEVLNPTQTVTMKSVQGTFTLDVPDNWSYTIFTEASPAGNDVYKDPVGTATQLAILELGDVNTVFFADVLSGSETLTNYANARRAPGDSFEMDTESGIDMVLVNQEAKGEHGGSVIFLYASDGVVVAWLRVELAFAEGTTVEEAQAITDEWLNIGRSITISK